MKKGYIAGFGLLFIACSVAYFSGHPIALFGVALSFPGLLFGLDPKRNAPTRIEGVLRLFVR